MTDRLKAARSERAQAIEEKDSFLQKYYMEKKIRKEAEDKVGVVTPLSIYNMCYYEHLNSSDHFLFTL